MSVLLRDFASQAPVASGGVLAPVLAIDYGRRRIGLAISDALGLTARPLVTLERTNRRNVVRRLREIVQAHGVRQVVVGQPLNLDGTLSEMAAETARFAARLRKLLGLPVKLFDERLSSWEAEQMSRVVTPRPRKGRARRQSGRMDRFAAAIILRDFLEGERARLNAARPGSPSGRQSQER